jgi:hypothetical protein
MYCTGNEEEIEIDLYKKGEILLKSKNDIYL